MTMFFASDTHFGHKNIVELGEGKRPGICSEEHDEILVDNWNRQVPKKRSVTYLLGDVSMSAEGWHHLTRLNGDIRIILGNHDDRWLDHQGIRDLDKWLPANIQLEPVSLLRYKRMWLSHCPIHPDEMRKCLCNTHGHIHNHVIDDPRYMNVCMEQLPGFCPISLDDVRVEFRRRGIELMSEKYLKRNDV